MIAFECPNCGNSISVEDDHAGRSAWCRKCRRISTVPRAESVLKQENPPPGSISVHTPIHALGQALHPGGPGVSIQSPISDLAGPRAERPIRASTEPIDLKHIQPSAREEVRAQVSQAAGEVERLTQQRSAAVTLLQESASEISRLIGELAAAREENEALRASLTSNGNGAADVDSQSDGQAARVRELEGVLARKDHDIERLTRDWAAAREQIAALQATQAGAMDHASSELSTAMARDFDATLAALAERELDVDRLTRALSEAVQRLRDHEEAASARDTEIREQDQQIILERDERILELVESDRAARHEIEQLRSSLQEREQEYQSAYYELNVLRKNAEERVRLSHDFADISHTLVESRTRLKEQEAKRAALEHDLQLVQEQLAEKDGQLQRLRYEIVARESAMSDGEAQGVDSHALGIVERAELDQQMEAMKAQLAAATQRAWSLHEGLARATTTISEREADIESLNAALAEAKEREESRALELERYLDGVSESERQLEAQRQQIQALELRNAETRASLDHAIVLMGKSDEQAALLQLEVGQWQAQLEERDSAIQQLVFERDLAAQQRRDVAAEFERERESLRAVLSELTGAQTELQQTKEWLAERDSQLHVAQTENAQSHARDEERAAEIQRLKDRLDEASRQVEMAAFESESERAKWQPLVANHEEMKAALDDARIQLNSRDEQIRMLEDDIARRSGQLSTVEADVAASRDAVSALESQLASLRRAAAEYEAAAQTKDTELAALQQSLAEAHLAIKERDDRVDDIDFQVAGLTATLSEKEAQSKASALRITELERNLQARSGEASDLRAALAATQQTELEVRSALDGESAELRRAQSINAELLAHVALSKDQLTLLRESIGALESQEKNLRETLDERTAEVQRLLVDVAEFRQQNQRIAAEAQQRTRESEQLRTSLDSKTAEVEAARAALETLEALTAKHTDDSERAGTEMAELRARLAAQQESAEEFRRESAGLRTTIEEQSTTVASLQSELSARDAAARLLADENSALRDDVQLYRDSAEEFERELNELRAELERQRSEKDAQILAANEAKQTAARLDIELASLRAEYEQHVGDKSRLESIAAGSQEAGDNAERESRKAELVAELESLRVEMQRVQREADEYRMARERDFSQLTQQLDVAIQELSRSAGEIERLTTELDNARSQPSSTPLGAATLEDAFRLQHSFAASNEDLWRHTHSPGDNGSALHPEVLEQEESDEQKMLVDALLRFLGRR